MKRVLSLALALLMLMGCMVIVTSAEETYDLTQILGEDAVIALDTPVVKAPVQDGVVSAGEYTETRVINAANKTTFDYNSALGDNAIITESFAYDADWIYYAIQASVVDPAGAQTTLGGGDSGKIYFSFAPISKSLTAADLSQMGNGLCRGYGEWYAYNVHNGGEYSVQFKTQAVVDKVNATMAANGASETIAVGGRITSGYGNPYANALFDLVGQAVDNPGAGNVQHVYEIKVSRAYNYSADNTYTFTPRPYAAGVNFAYKLSDTEKAAFDGITAQDAAIEWLPRVITVADTTHTSYNFAERAAVTGGAVRLSTPTAVAPIQNGVIAANEYTVSRDVAATDLIIGSGTFKEHFAYDADWVYYAIEATGGSSLGLVPTMLLDGNANPKNGSDFYKNYSFYSNLGDRISVGWHGVNSYELEFRKADSIATANAWTESTGDENGKARWLSTWTQQAKLMRENFLVAATSTANYAAEQTVFEVKFSRNNCFNSDNNAYAYHIMNKAVGLLISNRLDVVEKTALEYAPNYSPRFIIIDEDITTKATASVRLSSEELSGLRFKTNVSNDFVADLKAAGYNVEIGTLIAPTDTLGGAELNHDFTGKMLDVKANVDKPFAAGEAYNVYAGSIVGIKAENLARAFSAVGYVKATKGEEVEYFYSDITASRDVTMIADAAWGDVSALTDSSVYAYIVEGQTYYSPYTTAQREILLSLIAE